MRFKKTVSVLITVGFIHFNVCAQSIWGTSPITEPYPYVNLGSFSGIAVPESPDPLVSYRWPGPKASDGLEIYLQKPMTVSADAVGSFDNLQSLTGESPNVTVKGKGSIQLDFGRENAAWLEFDSPDFKGSVEMSISEYNEPAKVNSGPTHPAKTFTPTKHGNTYRLELNSELYEGVRFGWIHVRSFSTAWHITGIRLVSQVKPTNYNGSFSCSDTMLTKIWYVGAYDVKLNQNKDYFGAILMDRGDRISWTGDAHPSQAASLVAFGNFDFIKKNIVNTSGQNNGIKSYSLYWVLSLIDYYNYTGDTTTLRTYINNTCIKLNEAYSLYGTNPGLGFYGWDERLGAGFENPSCIESQNAYKMLSIRAWNAFADAMNTCGRTDLRDKYAGYANAKIALLRKTSAWYQSFGLHAGADATNTGLLNDSEKNAIYENKFIDRVNRISFSPFNQYFVIQAYAAMNKYDDALSSIRDLWGGQIRYGGTTFFEDYRPSWNAAVGLNGAVPNNQAGYTSLCHPWGAGVVKWLSEEVLGIKPTSPGFKTFDILPHLGRTLTNVSGTTPTTSGDIRASFNVSSGLCSVSTPVGTVGRFGIPKVEKSINSISINGNLAWDGTYHSINGIGEAHEDSAFVYFSTVQPGNYSIDVSYKGSTPAYKELPEIFPATFIKEDSITSGNWGQVYGKDGYILCNYNGNGISKDSLPSYISSLTYPPDGHNAHPNSSVWASNTSDKRALSSNSNNSGVRNATCFYSADPIACRQTFAFTAEVKEQREYQIALYFLDWDKKGRTTSVEVFDANTLELIAPVKAVKNFSGGRYLIYTYNKSIKVRIQQVRGDNAVLSGIFFDPISTVGIHHNVTESNPESPFERIILTSQLAEISFNVKSNSDTIDANLFDLSGKKLETLISGNFSSGKHQISRELPDLTSGVYILQLMVNNKSVLNKKVLIEK